MSNNIIQLSSNWLQKGSQFLDLLKEEIEEWENKVTAKDIAGTIKQLLDAEVVNNAWIVMKDNKVILDTVKYVSSLYWMKQWWININLFNINKPWKDQQLEY